MALYLLIFRQNEEIPKNEAKWKQKLSRPSGGLFAKQRGVGGKLARPGTVPVTINKSAGMAGLRPSANTRNGVEGAW
mgnify:CR=1 FL=1